MASDYKEPKGSKPGDGTRFAALKNALGKKGAKDPGALAAYIGRKKYGNAKFQAMGKAARNDHDGDEG